MAWVKDTPADRGGWRAGNRHTGEQCITASWSRVGEAKFFFNLVQAGKLTLEQAEGDIRMTDAQKEHLYKLMPHEHGLMDRIQKGREQTWEAFQMLCAGELTQ